MFGGLLLTAAAASWVVTSAAMRQIVYGTPGLFLVLLIAELALVFALSFGVTRLSPAAAAGVFLVYSLLNGFTLSGIAMAYAQATIASGGRPSGPDGPDVGIVVPTFVPPLVAVALALLLDHRQASALAYVSGTLGTLIGGDLLSFGKLRGLAAPPEHGWVTLEGEVAWDFQKRSAAEAVRYLTGVCGVSNQITVKPRVKTQEIKDKISAAFKRNAELDANRINLVASDGKVTLSGRVHSWLEHDEAVGVAWAAPGVSKVEDQMAVA